MGGASVKKELEKSQSTLEAATIDLQAKIEENGTIMEERGSNDCISYDLRFHGRVDCSSYQLFLSFLNR